MDKYFFGLDQICAHDENAAYLTTVHNEVELAILRSLLDAEEIPYVVRERGSGSVVKVVMGYSMYGSDVFVPKSASARAEALLKAYRDAEPTEDDDLICRDAEEREEETEE